MTLRLHPEAASTNPSGVSRLKVLCIIGTRPEAIKMAPVIAELRSRPDVFDCRVCLTAQHREMLDEALAIFKIEPDHDLDLMQRDQSPTYVASAAIAAVDGVLSAEQPDWVLVQGDTTTAFAAAWAAFHRRILVGHVEAGLRTSDKWRPFPEEMNRRAIDLLADLRFAPTVKARDALLAAGSSPESVLVSGNTVVDALLDVAERRYTGRGLVASIDGDNRKLILVTAHRRESFGEPLRRICSALDTIAERFADDVHVVYSVHPNPSVRRAAEEVLANSSVSLVPPLDYLTFVHLMKRAYLILTDSGGIQEEAPSLNVPVLVLRDITEREEGIEAGTARLVGTGPEGIVSGVTALLNDHAEHKSMASVPNPYGDGKAARRIADALAAYPAILHR